MEDDVVVNSEVTIQRSELTYRATRAGGPGGQHVNTSSTKVELSWDVSRSPSITDEQRARIAEKLATRIAEDGVLRLTSAGSRSQHQNKEDVTGRFGKMIAQALHKPKPRRKTKPSRASKEARLKSKKKRSETKSRRGPVSADE
jgi:ribosome-associated protein